MVEQQNPAQDSLDRDVLNLEQLPGGHQDVLGILPPRLQESLRRSARVILVANNPAIRQADVEALGLDADDTVVTFNQCIKADLLTPTTVNLFVHGFNGPDRYFFGLPARPEINRLMQHPQARCFTLLVGCTGDISPLPEVALYHDRIPLPALWNYPVERPGGKRYVGPSTGFNVLVLLDWLRRHHGYSFELLTLGFSNEAGKLWSGHAWEYEREWLMQSDVVRIALQPRAWWQKILRLK